MNRKTVLPFVIASLLVVGGLFYYTSDSERAYSPRQKRKKVLQDMENICNLFEQMRLQAR